jgi:hypothetical protein
MFWFEKAKQTIDIPSMLWLVAFAYELWASVRCQERYQHAIKGALGGLSWPRLVPGIYNRRTVVCAVFWYGGQSLCNQQSTIGFQGSLSHMG